MHPRYWTRFIDCLRLSNARISLVYGMSECNSVLSCQLSDINDGGIPIGYPLPTIQCLLIDQHEQIMSQTGNLGEIGQIHIAG